MIGFFKSIFSYLHSLTVTSTKESSKRFMSLFTLLSLVVYVVVIWTDKDNAHMVLAELLLFIAALAGVATYESVQMKKQSNNDGEV